MAASRSNHRAAIAAVNARGDLTEGERRGQVRRLKADAYAAAFPATAIEVDGVTVSMFARVADGFSCVLSAPGRTFDNPFVFHNPPLLVRDAGGDVDAGTAGRPRMAREDVGAALLAVIADAIRRAG